MSISDIINSARATQARATVSLQDQAYHVKIHGVELGIRDHDDPDASKPNPMEIRYTQEFEIVVHKVVGRKPLTQCTIPDGLWEIIVKFITLKGTDDGLSANLLTIKSLTAGPRKFYSALFPEGLCCYIKKKEIVQSKGSKDWYHTAEITLIESNSGD